MNFKRRVRIMHDFKVNSKKLKLLLVEIIIEILTVI